MMVFLKRSADVACLKHSVFEAIAADTGATLQAVMVVIIAAWSGFIGTLLAGGASITVAQLLTGTMFVIPILALGNTGLSCSLAYLVGIRLSGGTLSAVNTTQDIIETHYSAGSHQPLESSPSIGAVFRVIGFTQVPDSLGFLLGIPYVGGVAGIVLAVWGLCVYFVGLAALGITKTRALVILVTNWLVLGLLQFLLQSIGPAA